MLIVRLVVSQPSVMSINFNLNLLDDKMANINSQRRDLSTRMGWVRQISYVLGKLLC